MTDVERMNGVLQRLGSPVRVATGELMNDGLVAALEAIEVRLAGIDARLQHRGSAERERELAHLAGLAGITYDADAGLDEQPLVIAPTKTD